VKPIRIPETAYDDELCLTTITGEEYVPKGKNLWRLLIGMAQGPMNWYYTMDEVKEQLNIDLDE
jgi:hypothetical protein